MKRLRETVWALLFPAVLAFAVPGCSEEIPGVPTALRDDLTRRLMTASSTAANDRDIRRAALVLNDVYRNLAHSENSFDRWVAGEIGTGLGLLGRGIAGLLNRGGFADGVSIHTPGHWHAEDAVSAGLDHLALAMGSLAATYRLSPASARRVSRATAILVAAADDISSGSSRGRARAVEAIREAVGLMDASAKAVEKASGQAAADAGERIDRAAAIFSEVFDHLEEEGEDLPARLGRALALLIGATAGFPSDASGDGSASGLFVSGLESLTAVVEDLAASDLVLPRSSVPELKQAIELIGKAAFLLIRTQSGPTPETEQDIRLMLTRLEKAVQRINISRPRSQDARSQDVRREDKQAGSVLSNNIEISSTEPEPEPEPAPEPIPLPLPSPASPAAGAFTQPEMVQPPAILPRVDPLLATGEGLNEAFIEIRVTKTRGNAFYRVMMDGAETPYLDVEESLFRWLDMAPSCDMARRYCQAVRQPDGTLFWIDGIAGQTGGDGLPPQPIPEGALAYKEGRLWLRHDAWPGWIPVTTNWSLTYYTLGFTPGFPLLADLKAQREQARRIQEEKRRQRERLGQLPALEPEKGFPEARYRITATRDPNGNGSGTLDYDLGMGLGRARAEVGAFHVVDGSGHSGKLQFWQYRRTRRPHYHLLEAGDTRLDTETLFSAFNLENGFRIDRLQHKRGAGAFSHRGRAQPGTEIDFYLNGFLEQSFLVGPDGFFELPERFVSGGDRIVFKYYYPDGSRREEVIVIAFDNARLLPEGEWDAQFIGGETTPGGFARAALRYGLHKNLSAGLAVLHLPVIGDGGEAGALLDLAWRPVPELILLTDQMVTESGHDYEISADLTALNNHIFRLELRRLADGSPLFTLDGQQDRVSDLWRLRHTYRRARLGWLGAYSESDVERKLDYRADYRVRSSLNLFNSGDYSWSGPAGDLYNNRIGATYHFNPHTLVEGSRTWATLVNGWEGRFRVQGGGRYNRWDVGLSAVQTGSADPRVQAEATWRITERFQAGLSADRDGVTVRLNWLDIIAPTPGPLRWDEFRTGTLSGHVMAPGAPGEAAFPVAGARIRASSVTTEADADGYYQLTGIPPEERIVVQLEPDSLDATLAPVEEGTPMIFRPGTRMTYDPPITWTAGLDGFMVKDSPIPERAAIRVTSDATGTTVAEASLEEDGFFLVEGLTPGGFTLHVTGVNDPPPPLAVTIPAGQDWVSDLRWRWP